MTQSSHFVRKGTRMVQKVNTPLLTRLNAPTICSLNPASEEIRTAALGEEVVVQRRKKVWHCTHSHELAEKEWTLSYQALKSHHSESMWCPHSTKIADRRPIRVDWNLQSDEIFAHSSMGKENKCDHQIVTRSRGKYIHNKHDAFIAAIAQDPQNILSLLVW